MRKTLWERRCGKDVVRKFCEKDIVSKKLCEKDVVRKKRCEKAVVREILLWVRQNKLI